MSKPIGYYQMAASVGSLLLLWSSIERELEVSLGLLDSTSKGLVGRRLDCWRDCIVSKAGDCGQLADLCNRLAYALRGALNVRNAVCHGLVGVRGGGLQGEQTPSLKVRIEGQKNPCEIPWDDLQDMFKWLDQCPTKIRQLSNAARQQDDEMVRQLLPRLGGFPDPQDSSSFIASWLEPSKTR